MAAYTTVVYNSLPTVKFTRENSKDLNCFPVVVDFKRLFESRKSDIEVIPGIPNRELFHAVVALYDNCLPDVTPEVSYACICNKWARTILLVQEKSDAINDLKSRHAIGGGCCEGTPGVVEEGKSTDAVGTKEDTTEDDSSQFSKVFSDTDQASVESSDESEGENHYEDVDDFLNSVKSRRKKRRAVLHAGEQVAKELVGIECCLLACATWEKSYLRPGEKIVHVDLISVRKRYRKYGIGKYLIQILKDIELVGLYDALVAHVDRSAVNFFSLYGFTDDIILNSKYKDLDDNWTNSTLMCYLPPFTEKAFLGEEDQAELDIKAMELEILKWTERSKDAYQAQYSCMTRMRNEIISLRATVNSQQEIVNFLSSEVSRLHKEKFLKEKEFLQYKLSILKSGLTSLNIDNNLEDHSTDNLLEELEKQVYGLKKSGKLEEKSGSTEELLQLDGGSSSAISSSSSAISLTARELEIIENFKRTIVAGQATAASFTAEVTLLREATAESSRDEFEDKKAELSSECIVVPMYYCSGVKEPQRLLQILAEGFSRQDFTHGDYGLGLYFSLHASNAAHFTPVNKMLVAEVMLLKTESVIQKDSSRTAPPPSFDSIVTPGRRHKDEMVENSSCQEYVIFDMSQAVPLYLIEYTLSNPTF